MLGTSKASMVRPDEQKKEPREKKTFHTPAAASVLGFSVFCFFVVRKYNEMCKKRNYDRLQCTSGLGGESAPARAFPPRLNGILRSILVVCVN